MARSNTVQVSGFGTISRSGSFSPQLRDAILNGHEKDERPSDEHQRAFSCELYDREGNAIKVSGVLYESQKGSLTSRVAFKLPLHPENLVWVEKKKKSSGDEKVSADEMAQNLLG